MRTPEQILAGARTIAVVGASRDPQKPAHWVPEMLREQGWRVIPVNPHADRLFGEHAYGRLADIPERVDVVEVFRPAREVPEIARQAAAIGAGAVWLQLGIVSPEARRIADEAGLEYVEDTCMGVERAVHDLVRGDERPHCRVYHGIDPEPEEAS
ncbi:CoA-binding protein [Dactylosporangium sp. NPDC005572]|uniref:CoA-binding protein n=1 Tax=Dactylosporangium sp. NPDC005572 TaxID=3156889 RepID=UPI0033B60EA4